MSSWSNPGDIIIYQSGQYAPSIQVLPENDTLWLDQYQIPFSWNKRISEIALATLTLLIAESKPEEKEMMINVVVNLINRV